MADAAIVRDLVFELSETDTSKVCIVTADDTGERGHVERMVENLLLKQNVRMEHLLAHTSSTDIVDLIRRRQERPGNVVFVIDRLEGLGTRDREKLFRSLNFRRDVLLSLNVPILMFISSRLLPSLVTHAPDFWSRRTATYYAVHPAVREIVGRLFREQGSSGLAGDQAVVSATLRDVFEQERQFNQLRLRRTPLASGRIEGAANRLRVATRSLSDLSRKGRRLDIALALWSLSGMDETVQKAVSRISREARALYKYLYDDRNEILVEMAEEVPRLLERYGRSISVAVKRRRPLDLQERFFVEAIRRINRWATKVDEDRDRFGDVPVSLERLSPKLAAAAIAYQPDVDPSPGAHIAEALRAWLEGERRDRPRLLSEEQGKLLRAIFRYGPDPVRLARRLGGDAAEVSRKVAEVREHVHLLLGVPLSEKDRVV